VQTVPYTDVEITLLAQAADATQATLLDVDNGQALFTTRRTTWLKGKTLTHVRLHFHQGYTLVTRY
jgi:GntR family histidine utilization transcriptional repressor